MLVMRTFALLSSTPSLRRRLGGGGNLQSCCCRRSSSHQSLPSISVLPPRIIMSIDSSSSRMRSSNDFGCCIRQVASVTSSLLSSCRERGTENQKSQHQQRRYFAATPKQRRVEANAPLLNEHLIAELFNKINKRQDGDGLVAATATKKISADTFQVRLIIDVGRNDGKKKKKKKDITDDDDDNDSDNVDQTNSNYSSNDTRIVTLNEAISISHELSLDLMEVTLKQDPPVIKAVSYDKWFYDQKKKQSKKGGSGGDSGGGGGGGGGAISDKPLKEFKFRAGIADHDLQRKTNNMLNYLSKGHAIRVTLTARGFSLNEDADAIKTTLDRVKELIGDKAVEARGMKANDRMSVGNLVFHPNKKIADAKKI